MALFLYPKTDESEVISMARAQDPRIEGEGHVPGRHEVG